MFSLIVAYDKNHCIGAKGKMAWHIPGELKRFKQLTTGHTIVMGWNTFAGLKEELPNRKTILISRNHIRHTQNCISTPDFQEFLNAHKNTKEEIFIVGGAQIYQQALPYVKKFYITEIDMQVQNGDVYFPKLDFSDMQKTYEEKVNGEIPYTYFTYERTKTKEK